MTDLCNVLQQLLDSKKATNIVTIDFEGKSSLVDYFMICTAGNIRQMDALTDAVVDYCKQQNIEVKSIQGKADQGWVLIDLQEIVIHLFTEEMRNTYQLEKLWSQMKVVRMS